ncbi:dihydroorotase [Gayadomonas joobiniege]|uniref:dihydroorotase n=1 Tax=Gayadomonas joobiniege TaxID=1234606 RepID=UPI0003669EFF|nr:dihydroorotase [Gayadomonas joobiniege]
MKTLIKNAITLERLMGGLGDNQMKVNLVVEGTKITQISTSQIHDDFHQVIDADGLFLSPGLVDPQVHFREPGMEYKEDIESGSRAAVKGGFCTVISMPNTSPVADHPHVIQNMLARAKEVALCHVYPTGSLSINLAGKKLTDFKALKAAGAIAITDDGKGVQCDSLIEQALMQAKQVGLAILDHSEDERLSNQGAIHNGEIAKQFSVAGIDSDSESKHVERGCALSLKTGGRYHVLHVSTEKSIAAIRTAKAQGAPVTVEVSPHHLLLCDQDIKIKSDQTLDANWKMNPPLRSKQDMLACQQALLDGTIDAIATDHAPHTPAEKALDIEIAPFGIIGLETAFPLMYTYFVKSGKLALGQCIDLMSKQAGALFNLDCGRIKVGATADLVLFDLDNCFEVNEAFFASKSKNSPFIGYQLYGLTRMTMTAGNIVYQQG